MPAIGFLYRQNEFLVIAALLALLLSAVEFGFRRGLRARLRIKATARSQNSVLQTGVMGLLALLLAFTFSMSVSRFETRKQLLVDECNTMGTLWSYAHLLPQSYGKRAMALISAYVAARLDCYSTLFHKARYDAANLEIRRLQHELWSQAADATAKNPQPVPIGLYVGALNEMFDTGAKRDAARDNQVPQPVLFFLFLVAALTMGLIGYGCGLSVHRSLWATTMVCLLISLAIMLIMDLDRPRRGLITISLRPMLELRDSMRMDLAHDTAQTPAPQPDPR